MAKGLLDTLLDNIMDAEWVGKRGEKLTEKELKWVRLFGRKGKILRNVYVPKGNGETSEIDVLYITQKGIFVIESKNYSGWIFGDEKAGFWTASLPNGVKNRFYNPIKQNQTHMKWLREYLQSTLGIDCPLYSLIVFSERCELKKVTAETSDAKVIKRDVLYAAVKQKWDSMFDRLTEENVDAIYTALKELTNVDEAVKAAHIESINRRFKSNPQTVDSVPYKMTADPIPHKMVPDPAPYKMKPDPILESSPDPIPETDADSIATEQPTVDEEVSLNDTEIPQADPVEQSLVCPKCGGALILRTAKKGPNVGNQFYGCSNFPKCKYTQNI